ncbi:MAG: glycosyltransferase [Burkholderiales bacterium]|nr:glycosyltransferase [Burkholderiales bacterium]
MILTELNEALRYRRALFGGRRQPDRDCRDIVMLVVSNLRIDPRVERAARAAAGAGYRVKVICPDIADPRLAAVGIDWGPGVSFRHLPFESSAFVMARPWLFGTVMHQAACEERPFAFHCHDLTTALIGLSAAYRVGAYCVCDFHEWYSENVSWNSATEQWLAHPKWKRTWFRLAERIALARADEVITVCDSIARELDAMGRRKRRPVEVIRNIPSLARSDTTYAPLRQTLGLAQDQFIVLWQGGTGPSRMIEPIIEALRYAPRAVLVIRGPSLDLFGDGYMTLARRLGVASRVVMLPPVPSRDVVAAAESADAGVWTLPNLSKNFYYALPNKIFEYMAAGLPVLAADYPEARKMVLANGVGLCFDPYDPRSIAAQITRLVEQPQLRASMKAAIPRVLETIGAASEWLKLPRIYGRLGTH